MKTLLVVIMSLFSLPMLQASQHKTIDACEIKVFGIAIADKVTCDGSNNQFCGHEKRATFTLAIDDNRFDAPVKRVGFKGSVNGNPLEKSVFKKNDQHKGLWDIHFTLEHEVAWESWHQDFSGSFFVETTKSTYYWLKRNNKDDFYIDQHLSSDLSNYDNGCN